ncbi:hypothetical protein B0T10DRAFT_458548 [Thelonectria olida]|uniref:Uncharacterized protein n=1 Tax=Thelonectria olida TaxID=1576542 RepID=A0A9P9AQW7_9HYPO|nr:hypothetical protein B0T10DRAFT_458548 [Thelonectria olida]
MAQPQHQFPGSGSPPPPPPNAPGAAPYAANTANTMPLPLVPGYPHPSEIPVDHPRTDHDPAGHPIIPFITHIAPTMFVPLTEDPSAPFTPSPSRTAELREILARLDAHTAAVRTNLFNLLARDAARIRQDARRQDAYLVANGTHPGDTQPGIARGDMAPMLNAEGFPSPKQDYNLDPIPPAILDQGIMLHNPREWAANNIMRLVARGGTRWETTTNLQLNYLKKEMDREAEMEREQAMRDAE